MFTLKLSIFSIFEPLHDVNFKATDKLFTSFVSMSTNNGKAPAISDSAMMIYSKMSLHAAGSGCIGYFCIWRNNIKNYRSQINSNIPMINPNSPLIAVI
jgi:hypothetical protein